MSEMPNFYNNYPGENIEHESDPKWQLGHEPVPRTGEGWDEVLEAGNFLEKNQIGNEGDSLEKPPFGNEES